MALDFAGHICLKKHGPHGSSLSFSRGNVGFKPEAYKGKASSSGWIHMYLE